MKLRALAVSLTAAAATSLAFVPAAGATTGGTQDLTVLLTFIRQGVDGIEKAQCDDVENVLDAFSLVAEDTTRSELVAELNELVPAEIRFLGLATAPLISAVGDKAVECEIVQPDPFDPFASSSALLNGDFSGLLTLLPSLSSDVDFDLDSLLPSLT